jgi:hypothetical protein
MTFTDYVSVAVHESGHAVASRKLSLWSGPALLRNIDGNGASYVNDDGGIKSVLVALAGGVAEQELLGIAEPFGCEVDDQKVEGLLAALHFRDWASARDALVDDVRNLVRRHRAAIAIVALHLLSKGELLTREIDEIVKESNS